MTDQVRHLLVPGLLGPLPPAAGTAPSGPAPAALERWLARADRIPVPADPDRLLFDLYGLGLPDDADLPTAALCYLADAGKPPAGVVYHADPVHLRPDQDRLLLFDAPAADLAADQTAALLDTLNAHLAPDGWRLDAPRPGRWYLHLAHAPALRTRPLGAVLGRNIDPFLPQGGDAAAVRQRLTEVQMLLHGHPVNAAREAAGLVAVNGLWLHGGGVLPPAPQRRFHLAGDAPPLLLGLQRLATGPSRDVLHWLGDAQRATWDADVAAWWRAADKVDELLRGAGRDTVLYPGDGHAYRCGAGCRWRLWRRRLPLAQRLLREDMH